MNHWILTADTLVYRKNHKLGKPKDRKHAFEMLNSLSGKPHFVSSALALFNPTSKKIHLKQDITRVKFKTLTPQLIQLYLSLNEWKDAAGAYKIQDSGDLLIKGIRGSFSNVMGLPISLLYDMLFQGNFF
jgi:septum formation protein